MGALGMIFVRLLPDMGGWAASYRCDSTRSESGEQSPHSKEVRVWVIGRGVLGMISVRAIARRCSGRLGMIAANASYRSGLTRSESGEQSPPVRFDEK